MIKNIDIKILVMLIFLILGKSYALENKIVLKIDNEIITTLDVFDEINELNTISVYNHLYQIQFSIKL